MTKRIDLTGQTFGRLTVTKHVVSHYWDTMCECGNTNTLDLQRCGKCNKHRFTTN